VHAHPTTKCTCEPGLATDTFAGTITLLDTDYFTVTADAVPILGDSSFNFVSLGLLLVIRV